MSTQKKRRPILSFILQVIIHILLILPALFIMGLYVSLAAIFNLGIEWGIEKDSLFTLIGIVLGYIFLGNIAFYLKNSKFNGVYGALEVILGFATLLVPYLIKNTSGGIEIVNIINEKYGRHRCDMCCSRNGNFRIQRCG